MSRNCIEAVEEYEGEGVRSYSNSLRKGRDVGYGGLQTGEQRNLERNQSRDERRKVSSPYSYERINKILNRDMRDNHSTSPSQRQSSYHTPNTQPDNKHKKKSIPLNSNMSFQNTNHSQNKESTKPNEHLEDLDNYLKKNNVGIELHETNKVTEYLEMRSSILTMRLKDFNIDTTIDKQNDDDDDINTLSVIVKNEQFSSPKSKSKINPNLNMNQPDLTKTTFSNFNTNLHSKLMKSGSIYAEPHGYQQKNNDLSIVIDDSHQNRQNQNYSIFQNLESNLQDKTTSFILQTKLDEFMSNNDGSMYHAQKFNHNKTQPVYKNDYGNGSSVKRFNLVANRTVIGKNDLVKGEFSRGMDDTERYHGDKSLNVDNIESGWREDKRYGRDVINEESESNNEMGHIMMDDKGNILQHPTSHPNNNPSPHPNQDPSPDQDTQSTNNKVTHLRTLIENPNNDISINNDSIKSELFENSDKKKQPELLIIEQNKPIKKRTFNLGKQRKQSKKEFKNDSVKNVDNEKIHTNLELGYGGEPGEREQKEVVQKGVELELGFDGKRF